MSKGEIYCSYVSVNLQLSFRGCVKEIKVRFFWRNRWISKWRTAFDRSQKFWGSPRIFRQKKRLLILVYFFVLLWQYSKRKFLIIFIINFENNENKTKCSLLILKKIFKGVPLDEGLGSHEGLSKFSTTFGRGVFITLAFENLSFIHVNFKHLFLFLFGSYLRFYLVLKALKEGWKERQRK